MYFDAILPEIYTFIEFTIHGYITANKKGEHEYLTHLAGDIPAEHPMPYNVYVLVREFLAKNNDQIEDVVEFLKDEFSQKKYDFKKVEVSAGKCTIKQKFRRSKEYPQINVKLQW